MELFKIFNLSWLFNKHRRTTATSLWSIVQGQSYFINENCGQRIFEDKARIGLSAGITLKAMLLGQVNFLAIPSICQIQNAFWATQKMRKQEEKYHIYFFE